MSKLLLVTPVAPNSPPGGRAQLALLHHRCLQDLFGTDFLVHQLEQRAVGIGQRLTGHLDGITPALEGQLAERIRAEGIGKVYLDGSNLGRLARAIKRASASAEVLTFFHNVETRFFLGSLKREKSPRALGVLIANAVAERLSVRWSDRLITLSERDGRLLEKLYGRGATDILPMAIEDKLPPGSIECEPSAETGYALFVGGAFYANLDGIRWYAREVAPHLSMQTIVIGRGMEAIRGEVERGGRVRVVGPVERLDLWYRNAKVVIAPIFDGSGMKTKVAEALMFGKRVVGTPEAFSGYEAVADRAGRLCRDRSEFVAALRSVHSAEIPTFDPGLRALYERDHSVEAASRRLRAILGTSAHTYPATA